MLGPDWACPGWWVQLMSGEKESSPSTCAASLALEKLFLSVRLSGAPRILTLAIGRKDLCLLISL